MDKEKGEVEQQMEIVGEEGKKRKESRDKEVDWPERALQPYSSENWSEGDDEPDGMTIIDPLVTMALSAKLEQGGREY